MLFPRPAAIAAFSSADTISIPAQNPANKPRRAPFPSFSPLPTNLVRLARTFLQKPSRAPRGYASQPSSSFMPPIVPTLARHDRIPDLRAGVAPLVHQFSGEIYVIHCLGFCGFLQVCSEVVAAFNDLVIKEGLVEFLQAGGKLSGVDRPDTVVFGGRKNQGFGIGNVAPQLVIRRDGCEECAFFGNGNRAVLADPGGTRCDLF